MKRYLMTTIICLLVVSSLSFAAKPQNPILERIGVERGICVLPGDSAC